MDRFIDLHTHTVCSDGTFTPAESVKLAKEKGLAAIAITDHDTIDGLQEAIEAGEKYGVKVITGIEFSVASDTEMHLLGLGFKMPCPAIQNVLDKMIAERDKRNFVVIDLLKKLGMELTINDILAEATSRVTGRSQIAKAMIKKGYVKTVKEAFDKYLAFGKPAFVERSTLSPEEAIKIIKESSGIASLAHLNQIGKSDEELYTMLKHLKACGLDAVEGYYTEYSDEMGEKYRAMAKRIGLKLTGGSDFHGENKENHEMGTGSGNLKIPYELLTEIGL